MPRTIVSLAKTTRPTLSQVLGREHLFHRMDTSRECRAVWISGPPGCGKTTFIASYAEGRKLESLWYHLDGSDNDIATFFFYLRHTILKHGSQAGEVIPELPTAAANWRSYGHRFFRALFSRFSDPLLVVFDNYETIPPQSELHGILAEVISEVPGRATLVFASRGNPPSAYARVRANRNLSLIDSDDLKFTCEESGKIAELRKIGANPALLERIHQVSEGWITGIILMLEHNRTSSASDPSRFGGPGNIVFDYLANEIFNSFDGHVRDFLIKVCWPQRLGIDLAENLSGSDRARQLLSNLAINNYFVTERDNSGVLEYVFHPLLRRFLQEHARKVYSATAISGMQRRTAELLISKGHPEEALELLLDNLDWEAMEPILARLAPLLLEQGRRSLLAEWLDALPRDRLFENPALLYWYARARLPAAPREARQYFERAFQGFTRDSSAGKSQLMQCCCGAISAILAETDDYSLLDPWINELGLLAPELPQSGPDYDGIHPHTILLTAMMIRRPDHEEINHYLLALDKPDRSGDRGGRRPQDQIHLSLIYLLSGQLDLARELLLPLVRDQSITLPNPAEQCQLWLIFGVFHLLCGDTGAVREALGRSHELATEQGLEAILPYIELCSCATELTARNTQAAGEFLARLGTLTNNRLTRFLYHYLSSWCKLLEDAVIDAHHEQQRALHCAVELGMPFLEVLSRTALAQLLFLCEDERGGSVQLRRVHTIARDIRNPLLEFMTLLVYGEAAIKGGRESSGGNALRYALGLGRKYAYYHLPWWHPGHLARICSAALQQGIETDYVRSLIIRRRLEPVFSSADLPDWPWPLRVRLFGGLSLEYRGHPELETGKLKGRPRELLGILMALGGRDILAQELASTMWPHVDEEYAFKSFTINLHRLRRLLGDDEAILLREGRLSINSACVWVDTWTLESLAGEIDQSYLRTGISRNRQETERLAERLFSCYQGMFLAGDQQHPAYEDARRRYDALFSASVTKLESLLTKCGAGDEITLLYQQALQRAPGSEILDRGLRSHLAGVDQRNGVRIEGRRA
ncbi:MAG: hypothetical protein A3I78_00625 [Gammaproteobacteria bacterium RIFCSPLOWO2_02_FULL_56_15]|nr:MAG: hypothetical protein A3I78_00625 [Gammaproteobacteria bacterium RIFCSPLOWO2_02_FULL_56_15]